MSTLDDVTGLKAWKVSVVKPGGDVLDAELRVELFVDARLNLRSNREDAFLVFVDSAFGDA